MDVTYEQSVIFNKKSALPEGICGLRGVMT